MNSISRKCISCNKEERLWLSKGTTKWMFKYCIRCYREVSKTKRSAKKKKKSIHRQKSLEKTILSKLKEFSRASKKNGDFYLTSEWRVLRYDFLRRQNGKCQCCGATAKDGKKMHVDHIKPRLLYPSLSLDINNLQLLCEDCNLGKGAWDHTDWKYYERKIRQD